MPAQGDQQHRQCLGRKPHKKPCKVHADRTWQGVPVCHIHDPAGNYTAAHGPGYEHALTRRLQRRARRTQKHP